MHADYHTISKCETDIIPNSHIFCAKIKVEDSVKLKKLKSNEIFN